MLESGDGFAEVLGPAKPLKDFRDVSEHNIKIIENFLNTRPRKVLNYLAPVEVIFATKNTTAVALQS